MSDPSYKFEQYLNREIQADEKLIWSSGPDPIQMAKNSRFFFYVGILWTFVSILAAYDNDHSRIIFVIAVLFIMIGFGMLYAPIGAYFSAKKQAYFITSKRAIVMSLVSSIEEYSIDSFGPAKLRDLTRKDLANGFGDIIFNFIISNPNTSQWHKSPGNGFYGIQNTADVEKLLNELSEKEIAEE
jgi:hypothetical protein